MLNIRDIFSCKIVFELHVRCGSSTLSTKNAKTSFSYSTDNEKAGARKDAGLFISYMALQLKSEQRAYNLFCGVVIATAPFYYHRFSLISPQ